MRRLVLPLALCALLVAACDETTTDPTADNPMADNPTDISLKKVRAVRADQSPIPMDMSEMNAWFADQGLDVAVAYFEYLAAPGTGEYGRTVFASDRGNKQLSSDWVPNDPRRGTGTVIPWLIDGTEASTSSGLTAAEIVPAIGRAMQTWQDVNCSNIPLVPAGVTGFDFGWVQAFFGFGGIPGAFFPFVAHAGFLPGGFFDAFEPGGSAFILGVTFTLIWVDDGSGNPTDIDGNGKADVAFREIYYNDEWNWLINPASLDDVDVESVVLHESGHGLSQAHFGDVFVDGTGEFSFQHLHFAPLAVMNATLIFPLQELRGSDIGGHCSNWSTWPAR